MTWLRASCCVPVAICLALTVSPARAGERVSVVELFTSQGCSSCPPADALLARLAARPDLLALAYHVDYWDRLGWRDPFSSRAATDRQRRYARLLGLRTIYTPQIVVDGRWQAVGSDQAAVAGLLARARRRRAHLPVALTADHGRARIEIGPAADEEQGSVLLISFDRRHVTMVTRGENAGRRLASVDVVRGFGTVGRFAGQMMRIEMPIRWHSDRIAAVVQAADGRILGAAVADAPSPPAPPSAGGR